MKNKMKKVDTLIAKLQVYDIQIHISNNGIESMRTVSMYSFDKVHSKENTYTKNNFYCKEFNLPEEYNELIKDLERLLEQTGG